MDENKVRWLAAEGRSDPQIGAALGVTGNAVRKCRERNGIPAGVPPGGSSQSTGWEERIRALWSRELTVDEIAAQTGYTRRTVLEKLSQLNLPAWKR